MFYVYLLRSLGDPLKTYTGFTTDLKQRLAAHNLGSSVHTSKFLPWQIETYLALSDEKRARDFEKYLKSGSGQAFSKKRLRGLRST